MFSYERPRCPLFRPAALRAPRSGWPAAPCAGAGAGAGGQRRWRPARLVTAAASALFLPPGLPSHGDAPAATNR